MLFQPLKIILFCSFFALGQFSIAEETTQTTETEPAIEAQQTEWTPKNWVEVADKIKEIIGKVPDLYKQKEIKKARSTVSEAYFVVFEDLKMEAAMRMELGAKYTYKVERKFGNLRKAIKKSESQAEIEAQAQDIITVISQDAIKLDKAGISLEVFAVNQ